MNTHSIGCLISGLKLKFCMGGTSLEVNSQQVNHILLSQGVTGAWKSGRFHQQTEKKVVFQWYISLSKGCSNTHTHTQSLEMWGWGHSYGNAFKQGRHTWRVSVRKDWLASANGWGYLRDLYWRLHPLSVALVENKLEFCWNYDSGPLCCAELSVSLRGLQKCSFASVTIHTTQANFNIDLGRAISSFTFFFFFFLLQL